MSYQLSNSEFQLFRNYLHDHCGIYLGDDKAYLIESRLSKLLSDWGMSSFEELYQAIMKNKDPNIAERVIDALTTNETLWFRDQSPWIILTEVLLPRYINLLRTNKRSTIRIWSAAASTGQEAYSTAMCIDHYLKSHGIQDVRLSQFEIVATDISQTVLDIARKGSYDSISMIRGMDPMYKEKYFKQNGLVWELDERIKAAVSFKKFNLQHSFLLLGKFDLILCRYVLIYFADSLKADIANKLSNCMEAEGTLIIGASELYNALEQRFEMANYANGIFYKRRL